VSTDHEAFKLFNDSELYSLDEAAERLKVNRRQVRRWVYANWIRSIKMPAGRLMLGADLNHFLAQRATAENVEPGPGQGGVRGDPGNLPSRARTRHRRPATTGRKVA